MGYKMIANQMAGLLGHPVNVLPASMAYKMMYHGSELICILTNGTSMFQVPVATQIYARKRLSGLQYFVSHTHILACHLELLLHFTTFTLGQIEGSINTNLYHIV